MTIKELKSNGTYCFHCDITKRRVLKEIADTDFFDEWGCAFVSIEDATLGENIGVEYNLCIDNTTNENINSSAIYKVDYNENDDCIETDTSTFIPYRINFDDSKWKMKLENIMCKALIEFFRL